MKIKIIVDLKNVTKGDLEEIAKIEEIEGGWKTFIERELEIEGLYGLPIDYDIDYEIEEIEEVVE